MMSPEIIIWHNPDCATSRNTLAMIRAVGIEPTIVEYLQTPPDRPTLLRLIAAADLTPRALLRTRGSLAALPDIDLMALDDDALVDAMLAEPILINRPLVETPLGTRLCRPSEAVLAILPQPLVEDFVKEGGEVVRA